MLQLYLTFNMSYLQQFKRAIICEKKKKRSKIKRKESVIVNLQTYWIDQIVP